MSIWLWLISGIIVLAVYTNMGFYFAPIYDESKGKLYENLSKLQKFMRGPAIPFQIIWDGIPLGVFWLIALFIIPLIRWIIYYLFVGGISEFFKKREEAE